MRHQEKLDANDCFWPPHLYTVATLPCEMQKSCSYWTYCWPVALMSTFCVPAAEKTFWAHAVIKTTWCDTCDFLKDNNYKSYLLLFS